MDVHRARCVHIPQHQISCLAFSRPNDNGKTTKVAVRLALARTDGSIELWNPQNGAWVQETIFVSDGDREVSDLVWTQEPDYLGAEGQVIAGQYRLFSTGAGGVITEWNLETGTIKRNLSGHFNDIWCIAARPRDNTPSTLDRPTQPQDLVVGCVNSQIGVVSTEGNELQFKRYLQPGDEDARCMAVTYQTKDKIVAGFSNGTIRAYKASTGTLVRDVNLGLQRGLVWKVACLPNGDIISADSKGDVRIWDGKRFTMTQRFPSHEGDCLDLAVSGDGKTFFSVGVDGRIASFKQTRGDDDLPSWAKVAHRKVSKQHGPLKQLAAYDSTGLSVLVVGSSKEPAPVVSALRDFGRETMRSLPFLPQQARLISSPTARLAASWWDSTIYVYKFSSGQEADVDAPQHLVAKIELDKKERIRSVAISPDGDVVAATTNTRVCAFQMAQRSENSSLKIRKVELPAEFDKNGSKLVALSGNESEGVWLAAITLENEVQATKLYMPLGSDCYTAADMIIELERPTRRSSRNTGFKAYDETVTQLLFSPDTDVLVTGDLSGNIDTWELDGSFDLDQKCVRMTSKPETQDDSSSDSDSDDEESQVIIFGQTWKANPAALPRLDSAPLVLTFRPSAEQNLIDSQLGDVVPAHRRLLAISARHQLYEFDLREGRLTDWSRRNPTASLPEDFAKIKDRVMGAHWDPRERLWLYGNTFVFMLDVSDDLDQCSKKRKRKEDMARSNKRVKSSGAGNMIMRGGLSGPHTQPQTALKKVKQATSLATTEELMAESDEDDEDEDDVVELGLTANSDESESDTRIRTNKKALSHWLTFKYRPILGMVMLNPAHRGPGDQDDVLEVAIVERQAELYVKQPKRGKKRTRKSS